MRKIVFIAIVSAFVFVSCGDSKKEAPKTAETPKIEKTTKEVVQANPDVATGKKLFNSKGCTACHNEEFKVVGPALKVISAKYAEEKGDILKFLQGTDAAIVDTDPGQVAIMKSNLNTMLVGVSESELKSIVAYINSVK
ncbi:MAG: c-type cytochrome [Flavobacteriaceae bacterium]|nr:c-type cytochrome [Flavobacteriaceae bacterium]